MTDEWVVTMPKLGETVTEGTVGSWLKAAGDEVAFDDPLFEVSTDKVDSEIPTPYDGVMLEILVGEGETVTVGTVLARIGEPGATAAAAPTATPAAASSAAPPAAPTTGSAAPPAERNGLLLSPLVRRLVAEAGLDAATITGSGEGGRIRREDVERAIAAGTGRATPAPAAPAAAPAPAAAAAPAAAPAPAAPAAPATRAPAAAAASGSGDARDQVVKLSRMRLAVAAGMKASQTLAASVWTSVEVDFDNVERV